MALAKILRWLRRMIAAIAQVLILVLQSDASAPSPSPSPSADARADEADATWSLRYEQARAEMLAGRFADAAAHFAALAADAPDPARRTLAREQHDICDRWARGGLVLVRSAELAAARENPRPALLDRRSADEIGVFYTDAVLYGLATGVALDTWTQPSSSAGGILPALALGGVAAGLVYFLDHPEPLRYGVAQSITSGMWVGFEEGLAWTLWNQARTLAPTSGRRARWRPRSGARRRRARRWAACSATPTARRRDAHRSWARRRCGPAWSRG